VRSAPDADGLANRPPPARRRVWRQLRMAVGHLGALTGKVTVDRVLDVIFADFCIGK
jgi:tRNA U34 5-carboxymethylaminomethyl modifying GTPase MnmE/TrmE